MWWLIIIVLILATVVFFQRKHNRWLDTLVCSKCSHPLRKEYMKADQLTSERQAEFARIARDAGWHINPGARAVRFPCPECGTVHTLGPELQCVIDSSQEFTWPNPRVDAERQFAHMQQLIREHLAKE